MPAISNERYQCNCLTAHLSLGLHVHQDSFKFNLREVLAKLFALWPDKRFIGIPFAQFRHEFYLEASNSVAAEELAKLGMSEDDIAVALAKRKCGGCGFHVFKLLRDNPVHVHKLMNEAA